uniref:helix-turn-helix domain-containing protein n=1 Tax=Acrocarpospora macrocephala TaxID=150177 RepID=UPI0012D2B28C
MSLGRAGSRACCLPELLEALRRNGRARAIRFTTLTALCQALNCQPGDLLSYQNE